MTRYLFLLITMCWPYYSQGQPDEAAIISAARASGHCGSCDVVACQYFIKRAQHYAAKDSIILPSPLRFYSETLEELLQRDYHITSYLPGCGDIVPEEILCFQLWMEAKLAQKYGPAFLARLIEEADSLDRFGIGFQAATTENGGFLQEAFKKNFQFIEPIASKKPGYLFGATFTITPSGFPENIIVHRTVNGRQPFGAIFPIGPSDRICKDAALQISKMCFAPARFRGKAVSSKRGILWAASR